MKAPNKIYVEVCEDGIFAFPEPPFKESVEYVRADLVEQPLLQEQPDFPTTDEQVKEFLATHPKIKVLEKYKNPDWLFKKQEQSEVDLKNEIITQWSKCNPTDEGMGSEYAIIAVEQFAAIARHFYELGLNARKED